MSKFFKEDNEGYFPITDDFKLIYTFIPPEEFGIQKGQYDTCVHILAKVLYRMFGKTDLNLLCQKSKLYGTAKRFSQCLTDVLEEEKFKRNTKSTLASILKKILKQTALTESFVKQIGISLKKKNRVEKEDVIPRRIERGTNNFRICEKWVELIKRRSRVRSHNSIRQTLYYILNCLKELQISISDFESIRNLKQDDIEYLIKNKSHKYTWKLFFKCTGLNDSIKFDEVNSYYDIKLKSDANESVITPEDLEKIYEESKKDIRTELIVLIFCTTGMRAGGLSNIKLSYVSEIYEGIVKIKDIGRTVEKNSRWFTFPINDKVKSLLWEWIVNERQYNSDTDYLFPGNNGKLSSSRIGNIVKELGNKVGLNIHPHSFRHTYANMLLNCGNSVESVSKLLGHQHIATTEKYYTKESAAQVSQRCNIPWLSSQKDKKIVPNFLDTNKGRKNKRRKEIMKLSTSFKNLD